MAEMFVSTWDDVLKIGTVRLEFVQRRAANERIKHYVTKINAKG